ncbi:hypothetical protein VZT92_008019 [Zoarces viviparus]|uniref:Uncharacterized protein n=1 Tax=Zoarces viviparus TaxID=48416 RepID=A0AAW1FLI1_ZOAVI
MQTFLVRTEKESPLVAAFNEVIMSRVRSSTLTLICEKERRGRGILLMTPCLAPSSIALRWAAADARHRSTTPPNSAPVYRPRPVTERGAN